MHDRYIIMRWNETIDSTDDLSEAIDRADMIGAGGIVLDSDTPNTDLLDNPYEWAIVHEVM